jgi:hypothetical protein
VGFRSFDLEALTEQPSNDPAPSEGQLMDLVARRQAALARDDADAQRWSDEGGSVAGEAAAERPVVNRVSARRVDL